MNFEDSLVVSSCLFFSVVRSKETAVWFQAVVVPLFLCSGEECVANEFPEVLVVGAAAAFYRGGRATLEKDKRSTRDFDPTRGFAGQDIKSC